MIAEAPMRIRKLSITLFMATIMTLSSFSSYALADDGKATVAEVQELIKIIKLEKLIQAVIPAIKKQLIALIKKSAPKIKPNHMAESEKILDEMFSGMPKAFMKMAVPLYHHHLTKEEVRGLANFYKTPVGRSVIKKMPVITQQAQKLGALLGQKLAIDAFNKSKERLRKRGYKL
jgi:uncharacterized protein